MAALIILNGPPASGKSTLAQLFVQQHPLALNLDIDVVRALLGDWLSTPNEAGLAARSLALAMAEVHLLSGLDVIIPQFLGRPDFANELAGLAERVEATFFEVALVLDLEDARDAFADRSADPTSQTHADAVALVEQSLHPDPIGEMFDAFTLMIADRPKTRIVEVIRGDIDATFNRFLYALANDTKPAPLLRRLPR